MLKPQNVRTCLLNGFSPILWHRNGLVCTWSIFLMDIHVCPVLLQKLSSIHRNIIKSGQVNTLLLGHGRGHSLLVNNKGQQALPKVVTKLVQYDNENIVGFQKYNDFTYWISLIFCIDYVSGNATKIWWIFWMVHLDIGFNGDSQCQLNKQFESNFIIGVFSFVQQGEL